MIVKMSSKGQLVIPKSIRKALLLKPGSEVDLKLVGGKVILRPIIDKTRASTALGSLRGKLKDVNLFELYEGDRQLEREKDERRSKELRA